jgi:hypothetical protein
VPDKVVKLGVTHAGVAPIHEPLSETVCAVPEMSVVEIVLVVVSPCSIVSEAGDAFTEKSNGAAPTVRLMSAVRVKPPSVPLTR